MDESFAWLQQGIADRFAAEAIVGANVRGVRCHAIAKWQQAVEKAIKAIIAALRDEDILHIEIGYRHEVERFISVLIRLPHAADNRTVDQHLRRLLDEPTRAGIRSLDALVPRRPPPGQQPRRNTEYPFQDADGNWTYPAEERTFSEAEAQRFRALAYRISAGASRIVSAVRRGPK